MDFMSPHVRIRGYHEDENVVQRMKHVDVAVVDLTPTLSHERFDDFLTLSKHLYTTREPESVRVILVENLSTDIIELLGSKYKLDPCFFEDYVQGIQTFLGDNWEGDKMQRLGSSRANILSRNFLNFRLSRPYPFESWKATWIARVKSNVPRIGARAQSLFLHERHSLYGPIQTDGESPTCKLSLSFVFKSTHPTGFKILNNIHKVIVLCDPLLDTALPNEVYLRNNETIPLFDSQTTYTVNKTVRKHISMRSTLSKEILRSTLSDAQDIRNLIIHTILSTSLDFHTAVIHELSLTRYRLDSNYSHRPKDSYSAMVASLNVRGGWNDLHETTHTSLHDIKTTGILSLPEGEMRKSLELEVQHLEEGHIRVHRRQAQVLEFLRQEQEIHFTRSVERLTIIAFLFLPFSTMATILSIDDTMRFGVFFALSVPISIVCIAFGLRGTSLAEISSNIAGLGTQLRLWFGAIVQKVPQFNNCDKAAAESDLESRPEDTGEF